MKIAVPRETAEGETRVALTPQIAGQLAGDGVEVLVQSGAGDASGYLDDAYREAGATIVPDAAARAAELIPARLLPAPAPPGTNGLSAQALCMTSGADITLMIVLRDLASGAQLWAQRYPIRRETAAVSTRSATAAVALTMIQTAAQSLDAAQPVFPLADLFSFARDRLLAADDRLAESQPLGNSAVGLSMRSWLRYTLIIERQTADPACRLDEAEQFTARARDYMARHFARIDKGFEWLNVMPCFVFWGWKDASADPAE